VVIQNHKIYMDFYRVNRELSGETDVQIDVLHSHRSLTGIELLHLAVLRCVHPF